MGMHLAKFFAHRLDFKTKPIMVKGISHLSVFQQRRDTIIKYTVTLFIENHPIKRHLIFKKPSTLPGAGIHAPGRVETKRAPELIRGSQGHGGGRPAFEGPTNK